MMGLYLIAFAVVLLAFMGLAIGVMFGREPLRGSCGGLGSGGCGSCRKACPRKNRREEETS